jgi:hypothetical protein
MFFLFVPEKLFSRHFFSDNQCHFVGLGTIRHPYILWYSHNLFFNSWLSYVSSNFR